MCLFAYFSPLVVQKLLFTLCGYETSPKVFFFHCCIGSFCLGAYLSPVVRCMKLEKCFGGFEALKIYVTTHYHASLSRDFKQFRLVDNMVNTLVFSSGKACW